ncbi:hypothetical protein RM553_12685 [Zunongwangia sp. F363]|uniref:Uncharacterized protein n=1 Tax=Autumnicola tepida TaxID=3075595 RepID=A0ABU3CBH5_9FLAO|nr:hypothetical protein [Zunongwangia sp. F363]MDT0643691.1 hypothetical protein [Zunongwangia sp. F363]
MAVSTMSLAKEKNFIQENWKPILGIGATIGVTYVVWNIYKDFKSPNEDKSNTKDNTLVEDKKLPPSSISDAQALNIANQLQDAMGTIWSANDEERKRIKSLLSGLTYNDYIKVSDAFGKRGYITATGISKDSDWFAPKKNLNYWLSKELQPEDFAQLKKIIPQAF